MSDTEALESTDVFERFVLLAVAELTLAEDTPVISFDVMERCRERADELSAVSGGVERRNVMGALTRLTNAGLLDEARNQTNPSGKGRPEYTLAIPVETLLEELADDDRLTAYVSRLE